mmetsp:Transcript_24033/g.60502  ORF Transcript_24033/g.60502 Transcript_24033/m.60502 type:complete len:99 (-) Transcript_24033:556-852(-)
MRPCLIAPRLSCGCSEAEHHHAANAQCSLDVPFDKGELAKRNEYISELRSKPMSEVSCRLLMLDPGQPSHRHCLPWSPPTAHPLMAHMACIAPPFMLQ